jgi:hypothetical protein
VGRCFRVERAKRNIAHQFAALAQKRFGGHKSFGS